MSDTIIAAIIVTIGTLLGVLLMYRATIQAARIAADKGSSQAGAVGEEGVSNQVSPLPPVGN